jgi:hypothetical protein
MEMWVRILNLPFGWMNERRGARAAGLIGTVVRMDIDGDGEANRSYLRARVSVEVDKPLRRGVMLKPNKTAKPEWFEIQFKKLPFYCFSCGIMGHTEIECPTPAPRNGLGKLPYDVRLRAPEERKKKMLSFGQAAEESFGSSMGTRRAASSRNSSDKRSSNGASRTVGEDVDDDATSPLKGKGGKGVEQSGKKGTGGLEPKDLFNAHGGKKRKPCDSTPDLNLPLLEAPMVPSGLVTDRIAQLGSSSNQAGNNLEVPKKQRVNKKQLRSVAVAGSDPRQEQ